MSQRNPEPAGARSSEAKAGRRFRLRLASIALGPALALLVYLAASGDGAVLAPPGRATVAVAAWMALWWLTEAVPLAVTALLPLVLFPLLGAGSPAVTAAPYAHPLVFLFLGGFILGLGMQRWGLHRRVALTVLCYAGNDTRRLIGAFMLVTAALSMWISNTAAVIMLLPIAVSVLSRADAAESGELAPALLLGVAYAASIGGVATLIGTPPNLVLAAFLREHHAVDVGMLEWLAIGLPMTAVLLPLTWWYLTRLAFPGLPPTVPGSRAAFAAERAGLGPPGRGERVVAIAFGAAVCGWVLRPWLAGLPGLGGLSDTVIALAAALPLFAIPVGGRAFAMDWDTARRLPWEILLLFGGGLSLAAAIARHGVDAWLASSLAALAGSPSLLVVLAVVALVVFLTEITSNTAATAALLPVFAALAAAIGVAPVPLLVATALAASCAFMLPVATPPNAVVFSSGRVTVAQMARAGFILNIVSIGLVTALVTWGAGGALGR